MFASIEMVNNIDAISVLFSIGVLFVSYIYYTIRQKEVQEIYTNLRTARRNLLELENTKNSLQKWHFSHFNKTGIRNQFPEFCERNLDNIKDANKFVSFCMEKRIATSDVHEIYSILDNPLSGYKFNKVELQRAFTIRLCDITRYFSNYPKNNYLKLETYLFRIEYCLHVGADPNTVFDIQPPITLILHAGVTDECLINLIKLFIEYNVNLNLKCVCDSTPLDYAHSNNSEEVINFLKENGAKRSSSE